MINKKIILGGIFTIEVSPVKGIILSIADKKGEVIKLNDTVASIGTLNAQGTRGRIIEIDEPHTNGKTDDVFTISFEDGQTLMSVGFKHLMYTDGFYVIKN